MNTVANQEDFRVPNRRVRRVNVDPALKVDETDLKRQVMWAPGLDITLSQRHDVKYIGINAFPAGTLVSIIKHGYYRPRNNREHLTVFSATAQRSKLEYRQPGVIARRLHEKFGDEEASGPAYLQWLRTLVDVEDDETPRKDGGVSELYEEFGLTQLACIQLLTLPIIPTNYGAIHTRTAHMEAIENLPLHRVAEVCQQFVEKNLKDTDAVTLITRDIDTAMAAFNGTENEALLGRCITEMVLGCRTATVRLDNARTMLIAEMDSSSRNKAGKPAPDEGDKKICRLLGEPLPHVTRNVRQDPAAVARGTVEMTPDMAESKHCIACDEIIRIRAKKCRFCSEAQPEMIEPGELVAEPGVRVAIAASAAAKIPTEGGASELFNEVAAGADAPPSVDLTSTKPITVDVTEPAVLPANRTVKSAADRAAEKAAKLRAEAGG